MAETVDRAFVMAYTAELHRLAEQRESKFRSAVRVKTGVTGKNYNFERLGPSDLAPIVGRHSATNILNPEHSRRRLTFSDRGGAILLDRHDEYKMLIAPKNDYANNHADSYNRFLDDLCIAALTGSATSVLADDTTSAVAIGSAQQIAAGGTGLTFEKVNQANRILNQGDVELEDRYFAMSPQGLEDLLAETEVTSSDFTNLMALQTGTLTGPYMGFRWIMTTRLAAVTTTRTAIAWQKKGIGLAIGLDIEIHIDRRPDLNNCWQVNALVGAGAVRIEEARVVQCDFVES
jgi:hypothetical protein